MRMFWVMAWAVVLFVFTCAANSSFWATGDLPIFHWTHSPDYHELLRMDLKATYGFIFRKIGHFSCFGFLAVLIYYRNKSVSKSIMYAIAYAVLTEFLQLYFARDGRIYDMFIDSAGIVVAAILVQLTRVWKMSVSG